MVMEEKFIKMVNGYKNFREKYALGDTSVMRYLSDSGQQPHTLVIACSDSRVDPALILQCDPGDLFVVRNVANIVPPYEKDSAHHGTSAALEFGIRFLNIKNMILLGHSQCGGIQALLRCDHSQHQDDFITPWVSLVGQGLKQHSPRDEDEYAKIALQYSYQNCLTFPWVKEKVEKKELDIHLWFFQIKSGQIFTYCREKGKYVHF